MTFGTQDLFVHSGGRLHVVTPPPPAGVRSSDASVRSSDAGVRSSDGAFEFIVVALVIIAASLVLIFLFGIDVA